MCFYRILCLGRKRETDSNYDIPHHITPRRAALMISDHGKRQNIPHGRQVDIVDSKRSQIVRATASEQDALLHGTTQA